MSSQRTKEQYNRLLSYHPEGGARNLGGAKTVWIPDAKEGFIRGTIVSTDGDKLNLKLGDGGNKTLPSKNTLPANPPKFDGVADCAELSHLNNATVFHNLRVRYVEDLIHTSSGLFLVVINPYKWIPIYTPEMIEMYRGKRRNEVHPHTYAIADEAYRAMMRNSKDQSMLITGESGAGKTENTKKVIQYLATIAGKASQGGKLEEQILQANPMLEAFGNAKTNKNDNSSRFGKFIRIQFSGGLICGTTIQSYLLEKSRVTYQGRGERNFHIFYQLLKGATAAQKQQYHLRDMGWYKLFCDPDSNRCKSMDDAEEWEATTKAMTVIGLSQKEQDSVFRMVSGVMLAGNIKYEGSYGGSGAKISNPEVVEQISELWGMDNAAFEKSLIRPKVKAGTEIVEKHLSPEEAAYARNAMCKAIYERSFLWLVKKLNRVLASATEENFIGVLDIAGFEIFEKNSFEQLCINFTNEKLQQFFNDHMFKLEQEEYAREKIDWKYVDFGVDSQAVIDLLEGKGASVFALLDEQTIFPRASDKTLISALHSGLDKKSNKYGTVQFQELRFKVTHYAGDVIYDVTEWITKNKDPLQDDIGKAIGASKLTFFSDLLNDVDLDPRAKMAARKLERLKQAGKSASSMSSQGGATFMTVSQVYQDQLNDLMSTLRATEPSFIRCIIPNLQKKPHHLQSDLILEQLACNGVLEGIRISRMGYPNRVAYTPFLRRYYLLHPTLRRDDPNSREASEKVMKHLEADIKEHLKDSDIPKPYFQYGVTKVFFRHGVLAYLEECREAKLSKMVVSIQSAARGWIGRAAYKKVNSQGAAARTIQKNVKAWLNFRNWVWWQLFVKSKPLLSKVNIDSLIKDQEDAIEAAEKAIASLEEEIVHLGNDHSRKKDKLLDLKGELDAARGRLSQLESQKDSLEGENAKLDADIRALEEQISTANRAASATDGDLKNARADLADAEQALSGEQAAIEALEGEKSASVRSLATLVESAADLEGVASRLKKQLADMEDQLTRARSSLEEGEDKGASLKKKISGLEADKDEAQEEADDLAAASSKLTSANKKLKSAIEDTQGDLDATKAQLTQVKAATATLQTDLEETEERLAKAKKSNADRSKKASNVQADIKAAQTEADEEDEARAARDKKNKGLQTEVGDLQDAVSELEDAISKLESAKRQASADRDDARSKQASTDDELAKLKKKLAAVQQELADAEDRLAAAKKGKAEAESGVKSADSALKDAQDELDTVAGHGERTRKEAEKLKKQLGDLRAEQDDAEAAADTLASQNGSLRAEVDERREALEEAEERADALKRQANALGLELEDVEREREEAEEERERAAKAGADALVREKKAVLDDLESAQRSLYDQLKEAETQQQSRSAVAGGASEEEEKARWKAFLDRLQNELDQTRAGIRSLEEKNKVAEKVLGATRVAALSGPGDAPKKEEENNLYGYAQPEKKKVRKEHAAWVEVQKRTFTRWANSFLVERMIRIDDLEEDFCDGVKLCNLIEIISGQKIGKFKAKPKIRVHKLENVNLVLHFLTKQGIRLVGVGAEDVVDGKLKLQLGLLWTIILRYQIAEDEGSGSAKQQLLAWINSKIGSDTKFNNQVKNFKADWTNGRALAALTEAVNPGTLDFPGDLSGSDLRDVTMAMTKATNMGVPELLLPEDMVGATDELSTMTYLSFFRSFEASNRARKELEKLKKELELLNSAWAEHSDLLKELAHVQREIFSHRDITECATLVSDEDLTK